MSIFLCCRFERVLSRPHKRIVRRVRVRVCVGQKTDSLCTKPESDSSFFLLSKR